MHFIVTFSDDVSVAPIPFLFLLFPVCEGPFSHPKASMPRRCPLFSPPSLKILPPLLVTFPAFFFLNYHNNHRYTQMFNPEKTHTSNVI